MSASPLRGEESTVLLELASLAHASTVGRDQNNENGNGFDMPSTT